MHSFARLITLTFFLIPLTTMANAEALSPEQATELLAKSQTIDSKCSFLSAQEHSALSNLVARAEIALAQQQSVSDASGALARGKAAGKIVTCSELAKAEISSILNAAQIASAQSLAPMATQPAETSAPIVASVEPAMPLAPIVKKPVVKQVANKTALKKLKPNSPVALAAYSNLAQRYYLQRRCGTMGSHAINALYSNVVATHQRTLLSFGKASTAAAMRRAEAQASAQSCS